MTPEDGARRLIATATGQYPHPHTVPYDTDGPVAEALRALEYTDPELFVRGESENLRTIRARVRYLAALWPDADLNDLTHRIHALVNNKLFDVDDLRLVLQGRSLSDPTKRTNEITLTTLQAVGRSLRNGKSLWETAEECRVAYGTVKAIENYLGIRAAQRGQIMDRAVQSIRSGTSIKRFARENNLSKTQSQRLLTRARGILRELGEIQ